MRLGGGGRASAAGHGKGPKSVRACEGCSMSSQTEKYFLRMRRRYLYESRVYCADTCSSRELPELEELPETFSAVARYRAKRSVLLYQYKGRVMHTVMPSIVLAPLRDIEPNAAYFCISTKAA